MRFKNLIIFTLLGTVLTDAFMYISMFAPYGIGGVTYISAFFRFTSIFIFIHISLKRDSLVIMDGFSKRVFQIWIFYTVFNLIRGFFVAGGYWDLKFLIFSSIPFAMISLVYLIGYNPNYSKVVYSFYIRFIFVFGFLLIPLSFVTNQELYSRIMIPVSYFILLIPFVPRRYGYFIFLVAVVSIIVVLDFRTNIIKIVISSFLILPILLKVYYSRIVLNLIHSMFFFIPLIILFAAIFGDFNIFEKFSETDSLTVTDDSGIEQSLSGDTRTFLYVEVLASMDSNLEWLIGKSFSGSYTSIWFGNLTGVQNPGTRYRSEVNILNILLFQGLLGVVLFFIILYYTSYIAINRSNNFLSKLFGLLIASRWLLSFIEEFTQYDINFYFFWLTLGLLTNKKFREMSNSEIVILLRPKLLLRKFIY